MMTPSRRRTCGGAAPSPATRCCEGGELTGVQTGGRGAMKLSSACKASCLYMQPNPLSRPSQVNLMLTAAAPEPHIQRLLTHLASTLCDHSVRASAADPRRLLPTLDSKFVDPVLGVAAPLAVGGQLAEASAGVLLLCSSSLDTKRSIGLGQYMAAGQAELGGPACPELCVPVEATMWTLVHEQGGLLWGAGLMSGGFVGCSLHRDVQVAQLTMLCSHDGVMLEP